jgi:hypothetical protein
MNPHLEPQTEFFDHAAVPPQIQELLDEWPDIDPGTARPRRGNVVRPAAAAAGMGDAERASRAGADAAVIRKRALLTAWR